MASATVDVMFARRLVLSVEGLCFPSCCTAKEGVPAPAVEVANLPRLEEAEKRALA